MSALRDEFRRGWPVILGGLLGIGVGVSSLYFYSLGVFIKPLSEAFGWGRGAASLGPLVGTAGAALTAIPVGRLVDRFGSKAIGIASLILLATCFLGLGAFTNSLASYLALTAALSLLTAGSSPLPYTRLVVANFSRHRGFALGLTLTGTGLGAILTPMLLTPFVAVHGWRAGYFVLAGVIMVATPITWLCLRGAPEPVVAHGARAALGEILAHPTFRRLSVIFFLASVAILGTIVQFIPLLSDAGLPPMTVGLIASLLGCSAIGGRLMAGLLADRFPPLWVAAGLFALAGGGIALIGIDATPPRALGAVALGLSVGAEADLLAFLVGRYFPPLAYGQVYGAIYTVFLLGAAVGPAVSGYLRGFSGAYGASLTLAAGLLAVAALITLRSSKRLEAGLQLQRCASLSF